MVWSLQYAWHPWSFSLDSAWRLQCCKIHWWRSRRQALSIQRLKDFNDCISYRSLAHIRSSGIKRTWHNKVTRNKRIISRLDRVLCYDQWIDILPDSHHVYLNHATSDHAPMLVLLKASPSSPKPFRFFKYWMQCEGFSDVLLKIWREFYRLSFV